MRNYDLIIIGAGPAGLLAAGRAAERGYKVLILEKMKTEGRKLLITGKGRCNMTNNATIDDFISQVKPDGRFLRNSFSQFFSKEIIDLLTKYGTEISLERGGRYFPTNNNAASVLKALLRWTKELKVEIRCGQRAEKLIAKDGAIQGIRANGQIFQTGNVILATGGKSYPATGSNGEGYELARQLGHSIVKLRPSLVPLETAGNQAQRLQGLSLKNVNVTIWVNGKKAGEEFGEMIFTHFGLSGPIILTISRFVVDELNKNNKVEITIDLKPALDEQKLDKRLQRDLNEHGKKKAGNIFSYWLPKTMIPVFIDLLGIDPEKECHQVSSKERQKILYLLKNLPFTINGYRSFKEAIITAGGISTKELILLS